jgi:hypothetical protein
VADKAITFHSLLTMMYPYLSDFATLFPCSVTFSKFSFSVIFYRLTYKYNQNGGIMAVNRL